MLITADRKIAQTCSFKFDSSKDPVYPNIPPGCDGHGITFQFPPLVTGDGRTGTWEESELPADMALSVYITSAARKWTLEWTYIVGEAGWTAEQIKFNLSNLRAYYTQSPSGSGGQCFIVNFKYGYHGDPGNSFSCRLNTIDISHKGPVMVPNGNWANSFRLRTDVKVGMQLWTKGLSKGLNSTKGTKTDVPGLKIGISINPKWE